MQVLIGIVLCFVDLLVLTKANYEHICMEASIRKPYIKIYDKRNGPLLHDYSPGIYDVSHLKNIYVCTNGPVWLFMSHYTKGQGIADVYDEPIYGVHVHECRFYNGDGGPGSSMKKPDWLRAIMLAGDGSDYTHSSMQLFTAPYQPLPTDSGQPSETSPYINVTSLVLINAHRCTIFKGLHKKELRVDVELGEGEVGLKRICYLPYQSISSWVKDDNQKADDVLKNEDGMTTGTCSNQNDKNAPTGDQIKKSVLKMKTDAENQQFDEFPQTTTNEATLSAEEEALRNLMNDGTWETDPTKKAAVNSKRREIDILKARQKYFEWYETANNAKTAVIEDSTAVLEAFENIQTKTVVVDEKNVTIQNISNQRVLLLENEAISEQEKDTKYGELKAEFMEKKKELDEALTALNNEIAKIQPLVSKIEITSKKLEEALKVLRLAKKERDATLAEDGTSNNIKYTLPSATSKVQQELINDNTLPTLITVDKTKTGDKIGDKDICEELPYTGGLGYFEEEGACNTKIASKLFGCQLLKASIGEPGICSYQPREVDLPFNEEADESGRHMSPETDPSATLTAKVEDFIPRYMLDVLDLIKSIYVTACDRVKPARFANRVNNILLCYLVRERQKNNLTVNHVPTKSRIKFWNKIMGALQDCESHKHKLIFHKESQTSNKYYLYHKMDLSLGEYFDVPLMKEQAENEFGFNFAIDMNWKVFATVLGLCMPSYESKIPLITSRFFTLYTEEFLRPLAHIWNSTGDNNVFKRILSAYYGVGGTEQWVSTCMEASYIYSSDISYRPPRKLLVNDGSEYNYFVDKDGKYKPNKKTSQQGCAAACKEKKTSDN